MLLEWAKNLAEPSAVWCTHTYSRDLASSRSSSSLPPNGVISGSERASSSSSAEVRISCPCCFCLWWSRAFNVPAIEGNHDRIVWRIAAVRSCHSDISLGPGEKMMACVTTFHDQERPLPLLLLLSAKVPAPQRYESRMGIWLRGGNLSFLFPHTLSARLSIRYPKARAQSVSKNVCVCLLFPKAAHEATSISILFTTSPLSLCSSALFCPPHTHIFL